MEEETSSTGFDIIGRLSGHSAFNVIQCILKCLDAESLRRVEKVSPKWKAAVSMSNVEKCWQGLVREKVAGSFSWKVLYDLYSSGRTSALASPLEFRTLFDDFEFASRGMVMNWRTGKEYSRDALRVPMDHVSSLAFDIMGKYVICYRAEDDTFRVWNRRRLSEEKLYRAQPHLPSLAEASPINPDGIVCALFEDKLVYTFGACRLLCMDLLSGEVSVSEPFFGIDTKYDISYLVLTGQHVCVAVGIKNSSTDIHLWCWSPGPPFTLDWATHQKLSGIDSIETIIIWIDQKYFVLQTSLLQGDIFDVRSTASIENRVSLLDLKPLYNDVQQRYLGDSIYHFGLVIYTTEETIKVYDVTRNSTRTLWRQIWKYPSSLVVRISSGNLYVCVLESYFGKFDGVVRKHSLLKVSVWEIEKIENWLANTLETAALRLLEPDSNLKSFISDPFILRIDPFDVTMICYDHLEECVKISQLKFLPCCSFCHRIKKFLLKCSTCKLVKYCDRSCQQADWNHHAKNCREYFLVGRVEEAYRRHSLPNATMTAASAIPQ